MYLEQQQSQQHQLHLAPQPQPPTLPPPPTQSPPNPRLQHQQVPSLPPIVQLTNTSTHYTPSYTIAPTTEIVTFAGSGNGYQLQQNLSASSNYLSPFGEPSFTTEQRPVTYCHRYPFGHQFQSRVPVAPPDPGSGSNHRIQPELFSVPIPGPSRHSDSFPIMTSRAKSKGKDRLSNKRGTSVMS